jgi:FKBP-type peptidyl-prolyl cis-trans isomerase FkpA
MKRFIAVCCLFLSALALHARAIQEERNLADEKARTSYALGMMIAQEILPEGLELDYAAVTEGLQAVYEKEAARLSQEEAVQLTELALEAAAQRQAEANISAETEFLAENGARPGVLTTPSGLQYEVIATGAEDGEKPSQNDTVLVHYEGSLVDGTVFDSSRERDEPEQIPLNRVIPGWTEGIQLMSVGSTYRLYIPSRLAYGAQGAGALIPPHSPLIFTVELLQIFRAPEAGAAEEAADSAPAAEEADGE